MPIKIPNMTRGVNISGTQSTHTTIAWYTVYLHKRDKKQKNSQWDDNIGRHVHKLALQKDEKKKIILKNVQAD
jgi:hypothetical protein